MDMVELEIVNGCFMNCRWCPVATRSDFSFMSLDTFSNAIDQVVKGRMGRKKLRLFGAGEPLLHPHLEEILDLVAKSGVTKYAKFIDFSTNGMLLTPEIAQMIVDKDVIDEFRFSVDGFGAKETFEYIRRGAKWEKVVENANLMHSLCEKKGGRTYCAVECILPHKGSIPEKFEELRADAGKRMAKTFPGVKLYPRDIHRYDGKTEKEGMPEFQAREGICFRVQWNWIKITWDGSISLCLQNVLNFDHGIVGHISKDRIKDVWFGNEWRKFRKMLYDGRHREIELCKDCDVMLTNPEIMKKWRRRWFWRQYIPELLRYGPIR